jgi:RNA polymerase sigma-70 factor (ECF subfamily)
LDVVTPDAIDDAALARLYRGPAAKVIPDAALGPALRHLFDEGRRAWPGLELGVEAFVAHLAERADSGLPPAAKGPDLYLACACATRVRGAVEAFDRAYLTQVGAYLVRQRPTPAFVDDVRQEVRDKLFVGGDGASPKIAEYSGKGALASWLRVVALRVAANLRRQPSPAAGDCRELDRAATDNTEMDYEEARYRKAFDEALRDAVTALDDEQRRILRRHFADGRTLDALAVELDVHRATVARRLAAARAALRREARRRLQIALGARDSELESLTRMLRSRLDLSLPSLFRTG